MKLNTLFEGFSKQIYSKPNESSDDEMALSATTTKTLLKTENKKYRLLLDDSIVWKGHTLYRIQYKKKVVRSGIYINASLGDFGGYIESLDNLSENGSCVVLDCAKVWGNAKVFDDADVWDNAQIYDDAQVYGNATVRNNAQVYGHAQVYGNATVSSKNAQVFGDAKIYRNAKVMVCSRCL